MDRCTGGLRKLTGTHQGHDKKELSRVASETVKIDQRLEYEVDNAVAPTKPLTEEQIKDRDGPTKGEGVSRVEEVKNHIRRENRLTLKDEDIYDAPEDSQAAGLTALAGA